jgi:hypothetical protein
MAAVTVAEAAVLTVAEAAASTGEAATVAAVSTEVATAEDLPTAGIVAVRMEAPAG